LPPDFELDKYQVWAVHLIGGVFGALRGDRYREFLKAGELDRFINGPGGAFGDKVPDGGPGSKLPGTGSQSPIDALRVLFGGLASGLGEVDRAHGVDPAADGGDDIRVIHRHDNGTMGAIIHYADGSSEMWGINDDGLYESIVRNGDTLSDTVISAGANPGECRVERWTSVAGGPTVHEVWTYGPKGDRSPGEGGDEANADRNPLSGIGILGPLSMQQMLSQMEHPGKDEDELDQNTGKGAFQFTKEDEERLGRTAPALDTLDPNSGIDPLTALNLDPNQMHTRSEKDDRVDPNTGEKPMPGGGG